MAVPKNKLNGWIQDYKRSDNTSGCTGVYLWKNQHRKQWCATLQYNKVSYHLGLYNKLEDAIKARLRKERELFGDKAPQKHLFGDYLNYEM